MRIVIRFKLMKPPITKATRANQEKGKEEEEGGGRGSVSGESVASRRRRRQHAVSFCTGVHHPSTSTGWHVCAETSLDVFRTKCHIKPGINILHFKVRVNRRIGSIIWLLHSKHMLFND